MKSVLIPIQPYWVFLIIAKIMGWEIDQEKTVEVRKNFPKDLDWNRISIIYCSKNNQSFNRIPKKYQPLMEKFLGKVIGEFVCDKIYDITPHFDTPTFPNQYICGWDYGKEFDCLSFEELTTYLNGKKGYAWHISDLVIYDKPRELSDFIVPSKTGCCNEGKCRGCKYLDRGNGYNIEDDFNAKFSTDDYKPLRRPPQSWCYVERSENGT